MRHAVAILGAIAIQAGCTPLGANSCPIMWCGPGTPPAGPPNLGGDVVPLGTTFELPRGADGHPITWHLVERDQARARMLDGWTLAPISPGGLTLLAEFDGRRVWIHHAVVDDQLQAGRPDLFGATLPEAPAFARPLVARDADAWARLWTAWWAPFRAPGDGDGPPAVPVDFGRSAVMIVDVDIQVRLGRPVATHVDGGVVHLAVPAVYEEGTANVWATGPDRPVTPGDRAPGKLAYAFAVSQLPPGARAQMAPFPEAPRHASVTGEPEADIAEVIRGVRPARIARPDEL